MIELFLNLLVVQALLGAFDTIYHHEIKVALPQQVTAKLELKIHAIRAMLYGTLFIGLAWFEWHGHFIWLPITLVLIEVALTLWDFIIEDQSRLLPASERITHTLLAINGGAAFVLLAITLPEWFAKPGRLEFIHYGWQSWFLSLAGIGVLISGLRDGFAAWQLQRLSLKIKLDLGGHKRLLISGGTGFIGSALCHELLDAGHNITLLTRHPLAATMQFKGKLRAIHDISKLSDDETFDVVVNLAGAPVVGPLWTSKRKAILFNSRIKTTQELMSFVKRCSHRPGVWVQASAIGFYGTDSTQEMDESSHRGDGFAAELCDSWEKTSAELESLSVRRVILRFGLVFGRSGGSLPMMLLSYRMGMGSILGDGKQHISWIHLEDLLSLIANVISDEHVHGKINAVAPDTPSYEQFAKLSGHLLHRPVWFHISAVLLRHLLGEMASLFVDGPKIHSKRLEQLHFKFRFPDLRTALMDLA